VEDVRGGGGRPGRETEVEGGAEAFDVDLDGMAVGRGAKEGEDEFGFLWPGLGRVNGQGPVFGLGV
jgi:hypothetical protein